MNAWLLPCKPLSTSHSNAPRFLHRHMAYIQRSSLPDSSWKNKIKSNPGGLFVVFNALKMFAGRNTGEAMMCTLDFRRNRFQAQTSLWGQPGSRTDCPGRLCCLHPGRFLRPGWVKPWVTWSDLRLALSWAGGWTWWPPGVLYYLWSY